MSCIMYVQKLGLRLGKNLVLEFLFTFFDLHLVIVSKTAKIEKKKYLFKPGNKSFFFSFWLGLAVE